MVYKVIGDVDENLLIDADRFFRTRLNPQYGGLLPDVFIEHGKYGTGFGNFLRSLWSIFKPVGKIIGKQALSTAAGIVGDVASGANWKESVKDRTKEAGSNLKRKWESGVSHMEGAGQFGGAIKRARMCPPGNKSLHSAVKLYSFVPPSVRRGRVKRKKTQFTSSDLRKPSTRRRRRKYKTSKAKPKTKRKRRTAKSKPKKTQKKKTTKRTYKRRKPKQKHQTGD